jgi:parvulin-like peptidyl-prolyl isomerase
MRFLVLPLVWPLALSALLLAQKPENPKPTEKSAADKPGPKLTDVVATINGQPWTRSDLEEYIDAMPADRQTIYQTNPQEFLRQLGMMEYMAALADKENVLNDSYYKYRYRFERSRMMGDFIQRKKQNAITATDEELEAAYKKNADKFTTAKVKAIYISFVVPPAQGVSEAAAKARAEDVYQQLKAGAEFSRMVQAHSETLKEQEGSLGTITKADGIPDPIKNVIFSLKKGEISQPVRHDNGYYIFLVEEAQVQALADVRETISQDVRAQKFREWFTEETKKSKVEFLNEDYFKPTIK